MPFLRIGRPFASMPSAHVCFAYGDDGEKLAGRAIEHVVEAVAIGLRDQLALAAVDRRVEEHERLVRIPVVHVFGRELEVPLHLAGRRIEREHRIGIEVVAGTVVGIPVRRRIAGGPVEKIELGIERAGQPRRAAAGLPAVALAPRLGPGLTRRRNRVRAPHQLSGLRVVGIDEAADTGLGARDADDDLAVERERRERQIEAVLVVLDRRCPIAPCRTSRRARSGGRAPCRRTPIRPESPRRD